jgi:hypothetical protein
MQTEPNGQILKEKIINCLSISLPIGGAAGKSVADDIIIHEHRVGKYYEYPMFKQILMGLFHNYINIDLSLVHRNGKCYDSRIIEILNDFKSEVTFTMEYYFDVKNFYLPMKLYNAKTIY